MATQHTTDTGDHMTDEETITVNAPLEAAEAGWVKWCASGHAQLGKDYAIRFEPVSGAKQTHVYLSGGGSASATREELQRFKQQLEIGMRDDRD